MLGDDVCRLAPVGIEAGVLVDLGNYRIGSREVRMVETAWIYRI
jgi:hypothetical protein